MNFTLITTILAFKRKKCEKVRVMKAHIGGKIMTFIVQDRKIFSQLPLTQIQSLPLTVTG